MSGGKEMPDPMPGAAARGAMVIVPIAVVLFGCPLSVFGRLSIKILHYGVESSTETARLRTEVPAVFKYSVRCEP